MNNKIFFLFSSTIQLAQNGTDWAKLCKPYKPYPTEYHRGITEYRSETKNNSTV